MSKSKTFCSKSAFTRHLDNVKHLKPFPRQPKSNKKSYINHKFRKYTHLWQSISQQSQICLNCQPWYILSLSKCLSLIVIIHFIEINGILWDKNIYLILLVFLKSYINLIQIFLILKKTQFRISYTPTQIKMVIMYQKLGLDFTILERLKYMTLVLQIVC